MKARGVPISADDAPLARVFRSAAMILCAFADARPDERVMPAWAVQLWHSFTDGTGYTKDEAILGLLLLAEVLETAE